ncbi:hypothetical protein [Levilactobacillus humaensis]|uniref:hypothetical protein n=1 Tax=Levilactobacillus humaensis TaxID=2950375 RepID=UPI0021C3FED0|nr:hypothetical protein [Levilactobacillus humaensis]
MKLGRFGVLLVTGLSLFIGVGVAATSPAQVVHAKAKTTLKTFPKSMRGTWYSYQDNTMYKYKITATKLVDNGFVERLHSRKMSYVVKHTENSKHPSWFIAKNAKAKKQTWVTVWGWEQWGGDCAAYRVTTHKLGGHKVPVLQIAGGPATGYWTTRHGYHTKKLAKKYGNHYYKGERKHSLNQPM